MSALLVHTLKLGVLTSVSNSTVLFLPSGYPEVVESQELISHSYFFCSKEEEERAKFSLKELNIDINRDDGIIGKVARHGTYFVDEKTPWHSPLNSHQSLEVIAFPVQLDKKIVRYHGVLLFERSTTRYSENEIALLVEVSHTVSEVLGLLFERRFTLSSQAHTSWEVFALQLNELKKALGGDALDILRLRASNFNALEECFGTEKAVALADQYERLVAQILPPHFPILRLPNGDIIIALDKLMTPFFKQKIFTLNPSLNEVGGARSANSDSISSKGTLLEKFSYKELKSSNSL
jgi:hypothetical protein